MKRTLVAALVLSAGCAHTPAEQTAPSPVAASAPEQADHAHHTAGTELNLRSLAEGAHLLEALGTYERKVSTRSPEAQAYFTQGLRLTYGFNHDEAARSFAKAAELDPACALCAWGASLTLGPNYNVPMLPERSKTAWEALTRARAAAANATDVEKALIEALSKRYGGPAPLDPAAMQPFNVAYAEAMRAVAARFPKDDDVQALFAEALMNLNPWKLWDLRGEPAPGTLEIVQTLEQILQRNPQHPGANHYYIHAVEASRTPGRAEAAAERLAGLIPGAGHVVHMPAHIFQRVGRYADASRANREAARVDTAYLPKVPPWSYYPIYLSHNFGFLAFSASMEGRQAETMQAAQQMAQAFPVQITCSMPGMDYFQAIPQMAAIRFGLWEEALKAPEPAAKYQVQTGLWLHARGMAFAATARLDEAREALVRLEALEKALPEDIVADLTPAKQLMGVAAQVLRARILESSRSPEHLAAWAKATALADQLPYSEPADWFYPVRHFEGAALVRAKKGAAAEAIYREDLRRNPKNGWALFGLAQSLRLQGKKADAAAIEREFKQAWKEADVVLTASDSPKLRQDAPRSAKAP